MFLRAGALSLTLLLASRLLGLLRESAQAAAFGASGLADAVVLMLTLPDWLAGVLASGALAYVMLPAWAGWDAAAVAATQRRLAQALLGLGAILALATAALREPVLDLLAGGLEPALRPLGAQALLWSAAALPMALWAALGATRLQHEREFAGMYGANLVVNAVLIASLGVAGAWAATNAGAVRVVGGGLLAAMAARLVWLARRQRPFGVPAFATPASARLPTASLWVWAALAAGLPLALPFAARSIASSAGEGALAVFNYAWKLVELPLLLGIQLVAALAFPAIARAMSAPAEPAGDAARRASIRPAFALAFAIGCACAAALLWASPLLARLLFGWGRMDFASLALVSEWARAGAWTLPPQAVTAVALVVLAAQRRLQPLVLAYGVALVALLVAAGWGGLAEGRSIMMALAILLAAVAAAAVAALGMGARGWMPGSAFVAAGGVLLLSHAVHSVAGALAHSPLRQLAAATLWALLVFGAAALASPDVRAALRR